MLSMFTTVFGSSSGISAPPHPSVFSFCGSILNAWQSGTLTVFFFESFPSCFYLFVFLYEF